MRRTTRSSNLGRSKCPRRIHTPTTHHSITHHHHHHHRRHHAHQPDPDLSLAGAPGPDIEPRPCPVLPFLSPHTFLSDLSMIDVPPHYILTFSFFLFVRLYIPPGLCIPLDIYHCMRILSCVGGARLVRVRPSLTHFASSCTETRLDTTRHDTTASTPPHAIRNPLPLSTYPPAVAAATATAVAVAILLPLGAPVRHFHLHSK